MQISSNRANQALGKPDLKSLVSVEGRGGGAVKFSKTTEKWKFCVCSIGRGLVDHQNDMQGFLKKIQEKKKKRKNLKRTKTKERSDATEKRTFFP